MHGETIKFTRHKFHSVVCTMHVHQVAGAHTYTNIRGRSDINGTVLKEDTKYSDVCMTR